MQKIKLALLFGGKSAEHKVSLISAASIYNNLDRNKFDVISLYINPEGKWRIVESPLESFTELKKGDFHSFLPWESIHMAQTIKADIYFPVLHGPYGEDGTLQGFLEMADVPYVGASVLASAVGMDKALSKIIWKMLDLPVVSNKLLCEQDWLENRKEILTEIKSQFPLPVFIKPSNLGSSVGITKVNDFTLAETAIEKAFRYDRRVLVEEGIQGREIECSVLGNDAPIASLPGEIIPFREFYDYRDKYIEGKTSFRIPASLPDTTVKEIQRISITAFKAIDCSGMARVDFFLKEKTEEIILNELNTIPGFTEISMYPKLWEASGISFPKLLEMLIDFGFERHQKKKRIRGSFPK
ncbi:MAG: D-alanine--D-alanine ligase family protein [Acidobacteriota bacterium]|nr:D-alanine--D-alanine ligase family protein [Acidobacteriota bacterium]